MSGQELLFVAFKDEQLKGKEFDHGISYATYLASLFGNRLRILLLSREGAGWGFDSVVSSVASVSPFPHAQFEAKDAAAWEEKNSPDTALIKDYLIGRCGSQGIAADVHVEIGASAAVIIKFLKRMKIDLVLLSPRVTASRQIHKHLVKSSPRPVVTMARGAAQSGAVEAWADASGV